MASRERGDADRDKIHWCYDEIAETGSEELKTLVALITGGHKPGIPLKEETKNEPS